MVMRQHFSKSDLEEIGRYYRDQRTPIPYSSVEVDGIKYGNVC